MNEIRYRSVLGPGSSHLDVLITELLIVHLRTHLNMLYPGVYIFYNHDVHAVTILIQLSSYTHCDKLQQ